MDSKSIPYNHPRGRFKTYFISILNQVYGDKEVGQISLEYFSHFKKQINNLNIPGEVKEKFCFENIKKRYERIVGKKVFWKNMSDVPYYEIVEYAEILLLNYWDEVENIPYKECKELFRKLKNAAETDIHVGALGSKLGIGDYFVQRINDEVELIYNLGDGYVARLPLQRQKIEEVIEENKSNAFDLVNDVKKEMPEGEIHTINQTLSGISREEKEEAALKNEMTFATEDFKFSIRGDSEIDKRVEDFQRGFDKGYVKGRHSYLPHLDYSPIPDSIYYTPEHMMIDVKKVIKRATEAYEEKSENGKCLKPEEFAELLREALVEEDRVELATAVTG